MTDQPMSSPTNAAARTREELLATHAEARAARAAAALGSDEHRVAVERIAEIEIEIARIERAMDPPRV